MGGGLSLVELSAWFIWYLDVVKIGARIKYIISIADDLLNFIVLPSLSFFYMLDDRIYFQLIGLIILTFYVLSMFNSVKNKKDTIQNLLKEAGFK